jgi:S-adenosylmethionine synthetase
MPDGKIQVTLSDKKIHTLIISYQTETKKEFSNPKIEKLVRNRFKEHIDKDTKIILIPFEIGGFDADTGLTGRKLILPYGPNVPIGGGNFSGKDMTKVDRSGAYYARHLAIQEIKKTDCDKCIVEMGWVIGNKFPLYIKMFYSLGDKTISTLYRKDKSVSDIIKFLKLQKPIYKKTSWDGHFGSDFSWEN